jgi:putative radical SAM enzyme (TIGR03279 family)
MLETRRMAPGAQTSTAGLMVEGVAAGSDLERAGVRAGDRILAVDGLVPRDVIDLQFELPGARGITLRRATGDVELIELVEGVGDAGALRLTEPVPGGIRECNNHCEFCFIRGLPRGFRPTLYVFDDDYRYSLLWGNFLTLTNLDEDDWDRIGYQRLSPLNVSVHATDTAIRRRMLNNRHAPPILAQLERLGRLGVRVNAQVVLCAGINDGPHLERTIADLARLHPAVQSVSVVPVGLTRYSRVKHIRRPNEVEAERAVQTIEGHQVRLRPKLGVGFVYGSDELYLLAGRAEFPQAEAYDGFPVLSNGVGMLRSMLDEWDRLIARNTSKVAKHKETAWLAGQLAAPALEAMAERWQAIYGWRPRVEIVENEFFGEQVTVSGLLTGVDLISTLKRLPHTIEDLVVPRSAFGFDGQFTLDGVAAETVGAAHPGRVHLASTPKELLEILYAKS